MPTPTFDARALRVREILARRAGAAGATALGLEAVAEAVAPAAAVHPSDVLARVDAVLAHMPADEVGDEQQFKKALQTLIEYGEPALQKLARPAAPSASGMTPDHLASLEAIVVADGSRPSFLLREGGNFEHGHPFLGDWRDDMLGFASTLQVLAGSVGRVQPANGNAALFVGTGVLVDRDKGLVLTNYHVVDEARTNFGIGMQGADRILRVTGDLVIDFDGETGTTSRNRFRVKEVQLPEGFGRGFAGLDAAVLRIEEFDPAESKLPAKVPTLSADADYANGASSTLVTVGFPGPPEAVTPMGTTVDWTFVIKTLFGNRFGVKRVAPGRFMQGPGTIAGDGFGRVLTHDATTFGGASGSLVFAWNDQGSPAFGLHFSGATLSANNALSLHKAANALRQIGVPLV